MMIVRHIVLALALSQGAAQSTDWPGAHDTLQSTGLPAAEIQQIVTAIEPNAFDTPASWTDELRAARVDLGSGPGLILRGSRLLCGGTGNCQVFVLRKVKDRWVSLFGDRQAPIADTIRFGPGATNGIKDLTVTANLSATGSSRVTYTFDGRVYRPRRSTPP
ncbi:MAG TPA: hypothetical protein VL225_17195 [Vicinamibacterales bacterium]|jgi:hypothetical protein|nr:hypothetical protein [Vicinamibacterales bacterium]